MTRHFSPELFHDDAISPDKHAVTERLVAKLACVPQLADLPAIREAFAGTLVTGRGPIPFTRNIVDHVLDLK